MVIWLVSEIRKSGSPVSMRARLTCAAADPRSRDRPAWRRPRRRRPGPVPASAARPRPRSCRWSAARRCPPSACVPGTTCQVPAPLTAKSAPAGSAPAAIAAGDMPVGVVVVGIGHDRRRARRRIGGDLVGRLARRRSVAAAVVTAAADDGRERCAGRPGRRGVGRLRRTAVDLKEHNHGQDDQDRNDDDPPSPAATGAPGRAWPTAGAGGPTTGAVRPRLSARSDRCDAGRLADVAVLVAAPPESVAPSLTTVVRTGCSDGGQPIPQPSIPLPRTLPAIRAGSRRPPFADPPSTGRRSPVRGERRPGGGTRTSAAWIEADPPSSQSDERPTGRGDRRTGGTGSGEPDHPPEPRRGGSAGCAVTP